MKRFITTITVALTLAATGPAFAATHDGPGDTQVYTPDGWKVDAAAQGDEAILIATDPLEHAALLYVLVKADNVNGALAAIDGIVGKLVTGVEVSKGKAVKVGGFKGLALTGTGKSADDGKAVSLALVALQLSDTQVLFAVGMVHTDVQADYKKEFAKALKGIRKTK